jgi:hypothetical protein
MDIKYVFDYERSDGKLFEGVRIGLVFLLFSSPRGNQFYSRLYRSDLLWCANAARVFFRRYALTPSFVP